MKHLFKREEYNLRPKSIAVALQSGYGGLAWIAHHITDALILKKRQVYGNDDEVRIPSFIWKESNLFEKLQIRKMLQNAEHIYFFGSSALNFYQGVVGKSPYGLSSATLFLSDSNYVVNSEDINNNLKQSNFKVFAMPDLSAYIDESIKWIPFYQYVDVSQFKNIPKKNSLEAAHSPGDKLEENKKGTVIIRATTEKLGIPLKIITKMPWRDCVAEKAKYTFFIDQCVENQVHELYSGGLGKSGIEALKLGSIVLTSGDIPKVDDYFPPPPIVWIDKDNIECQLAELVNNKKHREQTLKSSIEWADAYLSEEFIVNHIISNI